MLGSRAIVSFLLASPLFALGIEHILFPEGFFDNQLTIQSEIPGDSPIELCMEDEAQLLSIEEVIIDPNPPLPGQNLTVSARGTLKTDLVEGSYVDVLVRYGFITLVNRRYDLCELLVEVDLECPVKAGYLSLSRVVEIPDAVPPGEYIVDAKAYTYDDQLLTCLTASVEIEA